MSDLAVVTNWVPRELLMVADLPEKAQADFDYITDDDRYSSRIVCFKGEYYDVFDTQCIDTKYVHKSVGWAMHVEEDHPFAKWDHVMSDSFFSGLLFKITTDDRVVVGQYFN